MHEQTEHHQHDGCVWATEYYNHFNEDGTFSHQDHFYLLVKNCWRLTSERQMKIARKLWALAGRDVEFWDEVGETERGQREQFSWARRHMGRYKFVELFYYDDNTFDYRMDSCGGGGHSRDSLTIIDVGDL